MILLLVAIGAYGCAPEAGTASCRNDAECRSLDEDLTYCVQHRCAECVTNAACGPEARCTRGQCVSG
jgi:hypothetical protein